MDLGAWSKVPKTCSIQHIAWIIKPRAWSIGLRAWDKVFKAYIIQHRA